MRLGLCLAAWGGAGIGTALTAVDELGEIFLDLPTDTTLKLVDVLRCEDRDYLEDIAKLIDSGHHQVTCVSNSRDAQLLLGPHGPHTDPVFTGSASEKREYAKRCALGSIRLAERLGADNVRLLVGCPDFGRWLSWWGSDVSWADNVDVFLTHAAPIIRAAEEAGIRILLEPHPKQIVYDRSSAELVLEAATAWRGVLGLCVDPANLAAIGHNATFSVTGWGEDLVAVHAKDLQRWTGAGRPRGEGWSRYGPQPPIRFRAVGMGELNWPAIVSGLLDEDFSGVLYVEHEDVLLPRLQGIRHGLSVLRPLIPEEAAEGRTW